MPAKALLLATVAGVAATGIYTAGDALLNSVGSAFGSVAAQSILPEPPEVPPAGDWRYPWDVKLAESRAAWESAPGRSPKDPRHLFDTVDQLINDPEFLELMSERFKQPPVPLNPNSPLAALAQDKSKETLAFNELIAGSNITSGFAFQPPFAEPTSADEAKESLLILRSSIVDWASMEYFRGVNLDPNSDAPIIGDRLRIQVLVFSDDFIESPQGKQTLDVLTAGTEGRFADRLQLTETTVGKAFFASNIDAKRQIWADYVANNKQDELDALLLKREIDYYEYVKAHPSVVYAKELAGVQSGAIWYTWAKWPSLHLTQPILLPPDDTMTTSAQMRVGNVVCRIDRDSFGNYANEERGKQEMQALVEVLKKKIGGG